MFVSQRLNYNSSKDKTKDHLTLEDSYNWYDHTHTHTISHTHTHTHTHTHNHTHFEGKIFKWPKFYSWVNSAHTAKSWQECYYNFTVT